MQKQLINIQTQQPIVKFLNKQTVIYNKFLENEMRELGIPIPHGLRGLYQGKECIRLADSDFQKAFQEIYYLTHMDPALFIWQDIAL